MRETTRQAGSRKIRVISLNTVVIGTGAAGYNTADRLYQDGQPDIAIVTEHVNAGTSRNTGSDKQTYYKLSLSGGDPDSVRDMAEVLFAGQGVDGDIALCEAALSAQGFLKLADLGVPFPKNRYGEYIGYKTDHDPKRRATSIGPFTSKKMTECLQKAVSDKGIKVYDGLQAIRILKKDGQVRGVLCVRLDTADEDERYVAFSCRNVVMATGGPAGMYADSVYPYGHYGATGVALEAGAAGKNLTEWQFGLASVRPRWNVSGTYMQVLPRFISTDQDGRDPEEFLDVSFDSREKMLSMIFLKGYQWPFDVRKAKDGSSLIDLLVFTEIHLKGRRVFLDFRDNPGKKPIAFEKLAPEAYEYLKKAEACFGTPIERLKQMNQPAVDFYAGRGVDLDKEPLEIAECAQHNNGGLAVDCWWQTNIKGLFAAGEAAGTHGVYRPGGTALNAGQVGSARCAEYIAAKRAGEPESEDDFLADAGNQISEWISLGEAGLGKQNTADKLYAEAAGAMSKSGGAIRDAKEIWRALDQISKLLRDFGKAMVAKPNELGKLYRLHDTLICQYTYLSAMADYAAKGYGSRGSALYTDPKGELPLAGMDECFRFRLDDGSHQDLTQEATYAPGFVRINWRKVRPIPEDDDFFENVWRRYREDGNVY